MSKNCKVSIVIPVRDEAELLQKTLESFLNQVDLQNLPIDYQIFEVIILLNNCRDKSAEIARSFQENNPEINLHIAEIEIPDENANSGFVRRLIMNEGFLRLTENPGKGGIIMTTDGDTQVSRNWIAANIDEIKRGADAVGGRILFSENELKTMNCAARKYHLIDEEYRLLIAELESFIDFQLHDGFPRHHQHFNGSFAVTTDAFEKCGGVPDVKSLEDVAFFHALMRTDAKFRHSMLVKVFTSARNDGRTQAGLSTQLNDWKNLAERNDFFLVESADAVEKKFNANSKLRRIWRNIQKNRLPEKHEIENFSEEFFISSARLFEELEKQKPFGVLLENVYRIQFEKGIWNKKFPLVPVEDAVRELRKKLKKLRTQNITKTVTV